MRSFRSDLGGLRGWGEEGGDRANNVGEKARSTPFAGGRERRKRGGNKVDRVKRMRELYFGNSSDTCNVPKGRLCTREREGSTKNEVPSSPEKKSLSCVKKQDAKVAHEHHSSEEEDLDAIMNLRLQSLLSWTDPTERPTSRQNSARICFSPNLREEMPRSTTTPTTPDWALRPESRPKSHSSAGTNIRVDSLLEWVDKLEVDEIG